MPVLIVSIGRFHRTTKAYTSKGVDKYAYNAIVDLVLALWRLGFQFMMPENGAITVMYILDWSIYSDLVDSSS